MIVANFNVVRVALLKPKTDSPLIVNGDRILPFALPVERMQPIARWTFQVIQHGSKIHILKLPSRPLRNI